MSTSVAENIRLEGGGTLVRDVAGLPNLRGATEIFVDFETTSFEPKHKEKSVHPYRGDRACGVAITVDDAPDAWYVPIRHTDLHRRVQPGTSDWNLPIPNVLAWLQDIIGDAERWINAYVKFDAHVAHVDGVSFGDTELVDLTTLSKVHNSDRWVYGLKPLMKDWLHEELRPEKKKNAFMRASRINDFGYVPADIMGDYACDDVFGARKLWEFLKRERPEDLAGIWETEIALTPVLFDMEVRGLRPRQTTLKVEAVKCMARLLSTAERLQELTGSIFTNSSKHLYEVICGQLGLPVLMRTDPTPTKPNGGPSFNKEALALYAGHPLVVTNPEYKEIIDLIAVYRREDVFRSLFCEAFMNKVDEHGVLHPMYNQLIRTSRMSCSDPNSQQFDKRAKELIGPAPGNAFFIADASQAEYRGVVHYCDDHAALQAYQDDPNTDFHSWVAELCGIGRTPAKTMNFAIAYGAGKRKVQRTLASLPEIMEEVGALIDREIEQGITRLAERARRYEQLTTAKAQEIYARYHENLPTLQATASECAEMVELYGYVFNTFGRRRHLPRKASYKGFNSVVQSWAGDVVKLRMIALAPRYNKRIREAGLHMVINVHDALGWEGPKDNIKDRRLQRYILDELEAPIPGIQVPIRWDYGVSEVSWKDAA